MHSKLLAILIFIGGALCPAYNGYAQSKSAWSNMEVAMQSEAWLSSTNASGIQYLQVDTISEISLNGEFASGDYTNYNQADNSRNIDLYAKSYIKLNPKVWFYGDISYANFVGKNMGASSLLDPEDAPFNIVEYTDDNRGKKKLESYQLSTAVAGKLSERFSLGGSFVYAAANYVKTKDLRHTNKLLDMDISLGASYVLSKKVNIGLNYIYRKRVEEIKYDVYGNTDETYSSLISWGAFWGSLETFCQTGFTGEGINSPLIDAYNGLGVQLDIKFNSPLSWFNAFNYQSREGKYGIDASNDIIYAEHSGTNMTYRGVLKSTSKGNDHFLRLNIDIKQLENNKTNYQTDYDPDQGTSETVYFAPTKVLDRSTQNISLQYQAFIDNSRFAPRWIFDTKLDYFRRDQTASLYPYYRTQDLSNVTGTIAAKRNYYHKLNSYGMGLSLAYRTGFGDPYTDGQSASTSGESPIRTTDNYLYQEYAYLTDNTYQFGMELSYGRLIKDVRLFGKLDYQLLLGTESEYMNGNTYHNIAFSIGCAF